VPVAIIEADSIDTLNTERKILDRDFVQHVDMSRWEITSEREFPLSNNLEVGYYISPGGISKEQDFKTVGEPGEFS